MSRDLGKLPPDLLVTGFGPFPKVPRNPTEHLARRIAASGRLRRAGLAAQSLALTTAYAALETELKPALARLAPRAVLMLGVAARAKRVRIETRAVNRQSLLFPDAEGQVARRAALDPGRPLVARGRGAFPALLRALRANGVDAYLSIDAGRYLCNAGYFTALGATGAGTPCLFVHVPMPRRRAARGDRRPTMREMERALVNLALALARQGRRAI